VGWLQVVETRNVSRTGGTGTLSAVPVSCCAVSQMTSCAEMAFQRLAVRLGATNSADHYGALNFVGEIIYDQPEIDG